MDPVATVHVTSSTPNYRQEITAGTHRIIADEPAHLGGQDSGFAPYDLVLAGLGACTTITLQMYAQKKGWDIGQIKVDLTLTKDKDGVASIERVISTNATLSDEQWTRLLDIAGKTPVTKTLLAGSQIASRRG